MSWGGRGGRWSPSGGLVLRVEEMAESTARSTPAQFCPADHRLDRTREHAARRRWPEHRQAASRRLVRSAVRRGVARSPPVSLLGTVSTTAVTGTPTGRLPMRSAAALLRPHTHAYADRRSPRARPTEITPPPQAPHRSRDLPRHRRRPDVRRRPRTIWHWAPTADDGPIILSRGGSSHRRPGYPAEASIARIIALVHDGLAHAASHSSGGAVIWPTLPSSGTDDASEPAAAPSTVTFSGWRHRPMNCA